MGRARSGSFTRAGQRAQLHATAAGKVFLAYLDPAELAAYLARPLAASTPVTITDPAALALVVEETRGRGWAINRGELFAEAGGLAVPVLDATGACAAALGLNVPLTRLTDDRVRVLIEDLQEATRRLRPAFGLGLAGPSAAPAGA